MKDFLTRGGRLWACTPCVKARGYQQSDKQNIATGSYSSAASTVPARVVGISTVGRLDVGLPADVVVLDDNLQIDRVFVGGEARVVA